MLKNKLSLWVGLAVSGVAWAQTPIVSQAVVLGTTTEVEGLVTVTYGSNAASVVLQTPVVDRSRFVTSSSGSTTLRFNDGCVLKLKPNQSVLVDGQKDCEAKIAAIQNLSRDSLAVLGGGGGGTGPLVTLAVVFGAAIVDGFSKGRGSNVTNAGAVIPEGPIPNVLPEPPPLIPNQCISPPCP